MIDIADASLFVLVGSASLLGSRLFLGLGLFLRPGRGALRVLGRRRLGLSFRLRRGHAWRRGRGLALRRSRRRRGGSNGAAGRPVRHARRDAPPRFWPPPFPPPWSPMAAVPPT